MGKTISAYVNDALADEFQRAVETDGRPAANVAARAIDLYALLPASTRKGLGYVRDHGTVEEQDALFLELARAVARARYTVATRQLHDTLEPEALTELSRLSDTMTASPLGIDAPHAPPQVPMAPKVSAAFHG